MRKSRSLKDKKIIVIYLELLNHIENCYVEITCIITSAGNAKVVWQFQINEQSLNHVTHL